MQPLCWTRTRHSFWIPALEQVRNSTCHDSMVFKVFARILKDSMILVESPNSSWLVDVHPEKTQLGSQQGSISSARRFDSDFGGSHRKAEAVHENRV